MKERGINNYRKKTKENKPKLGENKREEIKKGARGRKKKKLRIGEKRILTQNKRKYMRIKEKSEKDDREGTQDMRKEKRNKIISKWEKFEEERKGKKENKSKIGEK